MVGMWLFRDTFKTRKQSFMSVFSICTTVPLTILYSEGGVIGKIFPLLKPKINSVYIMTKQVT